jgi:hypothetical protein
VVRTLSGLNSPISGVAGHHPPLQLRRRMIFTVQCATCRRHSHEDKYVGRRSVRAVPTWVDRNVAIAATVGLNDQVERASALYSILPGADLELAVEAFGVSLHGVD